MPNIVKTFSDGYNSVHVIADPLWEPPQQLHGDGIPSEFHYGEGIERQDDGNLE